MTRGGGCGFNKVVDPRSRKRRRGSDSRLSETVRGADPTGLRTEDETRAGLCRNCHPERSVASSQILRSAQDDINSLIQRADPNGSGCRVPLTACLPVPSKVSTVRQAARGTRWKIMNGVLLHAGERAGLDEHGALLRREIVVDGVGDFCRQWDEFQG